MPARLDRSSRSLRFGVALAAVLLPLGAAAPVQADATQAECEAEWAESDADDSCSNEQITPTGDDCEISAWCDAGFRSGSTTSIKVDLDSVSGLHNCNGVLTDGSCDAGE